MERFYSNGKLLITGEYLVLDGARSLALPTKKGQALNAQPIEDSRLIWESFDEQNNPWLQVEFDLPGLRIISETFASNIEDGSDSLGLKLQEALLEAKKLNPDFLKDTKGWYIKSNLDFPRNWGLGSSSTLINNIAQWAKIDAFSLQFKIFGGSGYDIACAQHDSPIIYQLKDQEPIIERVNFDPIFKAQLYFVHLNKKQNSRDGIARYQKFQADKYAFKEEVSALTNAILIADSLTDFDQILMEHERLIASVIDQKPVQQVLFSDYFGQTKSLGAWGGDFILATGNEHTPNYFKKKGFPTIIPYQEMVL